MNNSGFVFKPFLLLALFATSVHAELVSRLGGVAVYDTDRNITWIADANLAITQQFGLLITVNVDEDMPNSIGSTGKMTWDNANAWIAGMNAANYLGFNDWRLPTTLVPDTSCSDDKGGWSPASNDDSIGYNCSGGELGHLWFEEFDGWGYFEIGNQVAFEKFTNVDAMYRSCTMGECYCSQFTVNHDAWHWMASHLLRHRL